MLYYMYFIVYICYILFTIYYILSTILYILYYKLYTKYYNMPSFGRHVVQISGSGYFASRRPSSTRFRTLGFRVFKVSGFRGV